jgi:hypothetical protein
MDKELAIRGRGDEVEEEEEELEEASKNKYPDYCRTLTFRG